MTIEAKLHFEYTMGSWVLLLFQQRNGEEFSAVADVDGHLRWQRIDPAQVVTPVLVLGRDTTVLQSLALELARNKILPPEDGRELDATRAHLKDLQAMSAKLLDASIRRLDRP